MFGSKDSKDSKDNKDSRDLRDEMTSVATPRESKMSSVIGDRVNFNGTLRVEGSITIHGQVEGSIACTGQLVVGKTGRVKADLDVGSASIAGQVEGKVFAKERVELQTDSHLKGDVHAKSFVIQDGCFFQGNCIMGEAPKSSPSETTPVEPTKPEKVA